MNLIPPHGARLLGAWPQPHETHRRQPRVRRPRLARVLHPLHRPVELPAVEPKSAAPALGSSVSSPRHA